MPRVAFTSPTFSLTSALQAMGMTTVFRRDAADLTGMCERLPDSGRLYVKDVSQKAMVEMKESGVEAAAATAVSVNCLFIAPASPEPIIIDRPYLVSILDVPTGAVLFLGHIEDPTDSGGS